MLPFLSADWGCFFLFHWPPEKKSPDAENCGDGHLNIWLLITEQKLSTSSKDGLTKQVRPFGGKAHLLFVL